MLKPSILQVIFVLILSLSILRCKENQTTTDNVLIPPQTSLQFLESQKTGVSFFNSIKEDEHLNFLTYEYVYNGGGVALGDINNDGLSDIYLTGNQVSDKLYLNLGGFRFKDITDAAFENKFYGWKNGVTMADVNADGFLDIYVCRGGFKKQSTDRENLLFINQGNNTFIESAVAYGLNDSGLSTQAAFFDFDLDGDLDAYLMNHPSKLFNLSLEELKDLFSNNKNESDHLFRNDDNKFVDVSKVMGIDNHTFGLGLAIGDLNNDLRPDIYVANDYEPRDYMFMNTAKGFIEEIRNRTKHISNFGMGVDIADFNNDCHLDVIVMDMAFVGHERSKRNMASMSTAEFRNLVESGEHFQYMVNTLQLNVGNGTFSEIGQLAGVSKTDWSWGNVFADIDNDGFKDLVVSNGIQRDFKDRDIQKALESEVADGSITINQIFELSPKNQVSNYIFRNNGDLSFEDMTQTWGFGGQINSNGIACGDLDGDGDLDIVMNNIDAHASIVENKTQQNFLRINLRGSKKNPFGFGSKVTIFHDGQKQTQELYTTRGFLSSQEPVIHFGLGSVAKIDQVEVRWPDGRMSILKNVMPNQTLEISYDSANRTYQPKNPTQSWKFRGQKSDELGLNFIHDENDFNDFEREILLPHQLSRLGPCLATADVTGNGQEDLFIGGARDQTSQLFIQHQGRFISSNSFLIDHKQYEDVGALFFDADNDGDPDLYIASGGNDFDENDPLLQDRLYFNESGEFKYKSEALPEFISSTMAVKSWDYDLDGDIDLIIGGRTIPGKYPLSPESFILQNNKGVFSDVTSEIVPELQNLGQITDIEIRDMDGDDRMDAVLSGEWMAIHILYNRDEGFELYRINDSEGLWFSLGTADFNNDGSMDIISGNLGANNKFKGSKEKPFKVYAHDFDQNGTHDIVLSSYEGETAYPVRGRECSSEQMPFIADKFPTYKDFAQADLKAIYGDQLEKAFHKEVKTFYSSVFLQKPDGSFEMKKLPNETQFSPVLDLEVGDLNNDGFPDVIGTGNWYGAEVETVRYDAGRGFVMLSNGDGTFKVLTPEESGFKTTWNAKSLASLNISGDKYYLVGVNNGPLKVFKFLGAEAF